MNGPVDATPGEAGPHRTPGVAHKRHGTRDTGPRLSLDSEAPAWVYWMRNDRFEVIYIGVTGNRSQRLRQHRRNAPWWAEVADVLWSEQLTREAAEARESYAIARERPRHNNRGIGLTPRPRLKQYNPELRDLVTPIVVKRKENQWRREYEAAMRAWCEENGLDYEREMPA